MWEVDSISDSRRDVQCDTGFSSNCCAGLEGDSNFGVMLSPTTPGFDHLLIYISRKLVGDGYGPAVAGNRRDRNDSANFTQTVTKDRAPAPGSVGESEVA